MFIGPIFTRELATAPTRSRFYLLPAIYLGAQLLLLFAAWMLLAGTQELSRPSDLARFGMTIFPILAVLQLTLAIFFAALSSAAAIAQEKDRRTLILLLLTRLRNSELVFGRLLAGLLPLLVAIAASLPLWLLLRGLGGISLAQIGWTTTITLATMFLTASVGSLIAYQREKSFLILALTVLVLCTWLGFWTAVDYSIPNAVWWGKSVSSWAGLCSPLAALRVALEPLPSQATGPLGIAGIVGEYLLFAGAIGTLLNLWAVVRLRAWNPSREVQNPVATDAVAYDPHAAPGPSRTVWANPILWREIATWAYGKRVLLVKVFYLLLFIAAATALLGNTINPAAQRAATPLVMIPLFVLSLLLLNALAVNSITNERDLGSLDLLLVTDLTPREFIYGKLLGVWYGAKELVLLPLLLIGTLWFLDRLSGEPALYLLLGLLVLQAYVTMLGLHVGLAYDNSRTAVTVSLGIVFFLLIGVGTCMRIMIAFSNSSLSAQLMAFSAVIFFGSLGLYALLGVRNPSGAILTASLISPIMTFVGIMNYLSGETLSVFFVCVGTYGFATAALLIPAIDAFDLATGRTTD